VPYLSTKPLLPFLRRKIDETLLRAGRPASGIEQITWELSRITGDQLRSSEKQIVRILRGQVQSIWDTTADAIAQALGLGPEEIWPGWEELAGSRSTFDVMAKRIFMQVSYEQVRGLVRASLVGCSGIEGIGKDRAEAREKLFQSIDQACSRQAEGDVEKLGVLIPRLARAS
jgi:hypothetical protein